MTAPLTGAVGTLRLIAWGMGCATWHWLAGAPLPGRRPGPTRPIRVAGRVLAALSVLVVLVVAGVDLGVLGAAVLTPLGAAVAYRIRGHLDRVRVQWGEPIRVVDVDPTAVTERHTSRLEPAR